MVFVCFPQVQKSLNTDEFLTIFDKSEQNPPKKSEEFSGRAQNLIIELKEQGGAYPVS